MSKELDSALIDLISQTKDGVKAGLGFLQQQIPDVIQQLLLWKFYESIITIILLTLLFLVGGYLNYRQYKWVKASKESGKYWDESILIFNGLQVLWLFPCSAIILNIYTIIQLYFAPKIYLMEYAAHLLK